MELIERYLQAVKFWLPKEQKQDIIAELSEDIYSQVEEKESEIGRKLSDAQVEEILKQRGRPVLVANRYQPQEYLIGPVLFPIYTFVLRVVAICYLVPWTLSWIAMMIYAPTYRTDQGGWLRGAGQAWGSLWTVSFLGIGIVTVVFSVLEQVQAKSRFMENWEPRKLPPVRNPNQIKRSSSIFEFVANVVFGLWFFVNYMYQPVIVDRPEVKLVLSPVWHYFFWAFLCITFTNLALSFVALARPYWTVTRASIRFAADLVGSVLTCWVLRVNLISQFILHDVNKGRTIDITYASNLWMEKAFPLAVLICLGVAAGNFYRVIRVRRISLARPLQNMIAAIL